MPSFAHSPCVMFTVESHGLKRRPRSVGLAERCAKAKFGSHVAMRPVSGQTTTRPPKNTLPAPCRTKITVQSLDVSANSPATTAGLRIQRAKRFHPSQNFGIRCHRSCNRSTVFMHRNLMPAAYPEPTTEPLPTENHDNLQRARLVTLPQTEPTFSGKCIQWNKAKSWNTLFWSR